MAPCLLMDDCAAKVEWARTLGWWASDWKDGESIVITEVIGMDRGRRTGRKDGSRLLVVTSHGKSGLEKWYTRAVMEFLLKHMARAQLTFESLIAFSTARLRLGAVDVIIKVHL